MLEGGKKGEDNGSGGGLTFGVANWGMRQWNEEKGVNENDRKGGKNWSFCPGEGKNKWVYVFVSFLNSPLRLALNVHYSPHAK